MTRPKRLWAVALVNVGAGVLALALSAFMAANLTAVAGGTAVVPFVAGAVLAGVLAVSSILALLGYARARWTALGAALLFFGLNLAQSLWYYYHPGPELSGGAASIAPNVERAALAIVLNLWAFLSDKTDAFFDAVVPEHPQAQP
jgi:hypothetical protein